MIISTSHTFHVVPSMGPIVSVVNLQGPKTRSRKADQLTRPGDGTVYVYCTSVAISWANKME